MAVTFYPVPCHPRYFVTKGGGVYSTKSGDYVRLKPALRSSGYLGLCLSTDNVIYRRDIHRLIAEVLLSNWAPNLQVNHLNGIKTDNRLENLEMCTQSQNIRHAFDNNLHSGFGETHCHSKLTIDNVKEIKKLLKKGELQQNTIAQLFKVSKQTINNIRFNKIWRSV